MVEGLHGSLSFPADVEVLNLSLSGVALKVDRRLNLGTEYALRLELHEKGTTVKGVVVWSALEEQRRGPRGEPVLVHCAGLKLTEVVTQELVELLARIDEGQRKGEKRLGGLRFQIDAPGRALLDVPQPYQVKLISLRGMLIETEHRLDVEHRCEMEISLAEKPTLRFLGRVAYCSDVGHGRSLYQLGIEFLDMAPRDRRRLDAFIRTLAGQ